MNTTAPMILRSAHGSPSRVRGPENQLKPPAYVVLIAARLAEKRAHQCPVSGCCPVCRTAVA